MTGVYGETQAFVHDPALRERLRQWPVAVMLLEIFADEGEPLLTRDLGFADRTILTNAYDGVRDNKEQMGQLWEALRAWPVRKRREIRLPPRFRDPGPVVLCGSRYPQPTPTEGRQIYRESVQLERDAALARAVKEANRALNGSLIVCDGCDLADDSAQPL